MSNLNFATNTTKLKPALVLNANYQPLNYFPLSLIDWQNTITAVILQKVSVLARYNTIIHSPSWQFYLPSVVVLKRFVKHNDWPVFTRYNLFLRDGLKCAYCNLPYKLNELTFDHVIPKHKGGKTTWNNVVTACTTCNFKKGGRSLRAAKMPLQYKPFRPDRRTLQQIGRKFPPNYLHHSWQDYLYWDSEISIS